MNETKPEIGRLCGFPVNVTEMEAMLEEMEKKISAMSYCRAYDDLRLDISGLRANIERARRT